jgi:hypothetical protein
MQLTKSRVIFDQEAHTYTLDGVQLRGITGMIESQLFPDKYSGIPDYVMKKAADRGHFVHEVCELVDDLGVSHESEEAKNYQNLKEIYGLNYEVSEYLVSDNEHFASCIDKVYRENETDFSLADIKTTYRLDKEYVRWQLSIYAYLFEMQNPGCRVVRLFAIWLRGNISELVEVERIPDAVVASLMAAEVGGIQFVNPYVVPSSKEDLPDKYREMEDSIIEITEQAKYWAERKKELTDGVMKEMVKAGVYSWKGESISFIRKKDSIRKTFDRESFEKDYPGVYERYLVDTPVSGSITLKVS